MSLYEYDLVCIGSGPAGQRAAVQAAKLGRKVAVVEKRQAFGGVCVETGTIPSKTFREAIQAFLDFQRSAAQFGVRAPRRPDIKQLLARVSSVVQDELEKVRDQLECNEIDLINGHARFDDTNILDIQSDEGIRRITTDKVMLAVGTKPRVPNGIEVDGKTVITSDGVMGLQKLPRTMTVVGGGVIGVEYASMFANAGVQVTIVDQRPRPLGLLDPEIVDELVYQMRDRYVTFRGGEAVERIQVIENGSTKAVVELASGKHIVSDLVLFAAGRQAATSSLGLDLIGVETTDRGLIKVDEQYRTSVDHVFAAGDVIGHPALAATSSEQGRLAACHMFGVEAKPMPAHFPIGIYSMPEISMVGATEQQLTEACVPYETGIARYREISRGQILGDDSGLLKLIFHRETGRLLGVHVIGTGATELVHVGQAVLGLEAGLEYFLETVFNYPTLAECYKVAAYQAANQIRAAQQLRRVS